MLLALPWMYKVALCLFNIMVNFTSTQPSVITLKQWFWLWMIESAFFLSCTLPSIFFGVQNRVKTTQFITTFVVFQINIYSIACLYSKDDNLLTLLPNVLQVLYFHFHLSFIHSCAKEPFILLYASHLQYLHMVLILITMSVLAPYTTLPSKLSTLHALLLVFAAEVVSLLSLVQSKALEFLGQTYALLWNDQE